MASASDHFWAGQTDQQPRQGEYSHRGSAKHGVFRTRRQARRCLYARCSVQTDRQAMSKTKARQDLGTHQLVGQHQHRLQAEFPVAKVEQVLQARTQQVQHHDVVVPLHAIPPDVGDASCERSHLSALQSSAASNKDHAGRGLLPPCRILYSLLSYRSCGCFVFTDSCARAPCCQTMLPTQLTGARNAQEAGFQRAPVLCRPPRRSEYGCLRAHARVGAPAQ